MVVQLVGTSTVDEQQWVLRDDQFETGFGQLALIDCADRADQNARAASATKDLRPAE